MRNVFTLFGGMALGHLIAEGIINNRPDEYIASSIVLVCILGYIMNVRGTLIKQIQKLKTNNKTK